MTAKHLGRFRLVWSQKRQAYFLIDPKGRRCSRAFTGTTALSRISQLRDKMNQAYFMGLQDRGGTS